MNEQQTLQQAASGSFTRRRFLGFAGALAGAGIIIAGMDSCKKDPDPLEGAIDLGGGDPGVLNYLYVMAQLQAAFYTQVVLFFSSSFLSDLEQKYLTDIRDHEIAHREFL